MSLAYELFKESSKVKDTDITKSYYLNWAYKHNLNNYRVLSYGNLVKLMQGGVEIPFYVIDFVRESGEVVLIASLFKNKLINIYMRSLKLKKFCVVTEVPSIPYGLGMMSLYFQYGLPIVCTEGFMDRDVIYSFYPNVVAVLSAGMSVIQREILTKFTNKFLLLYDNDKAGLEASRRDYYFLKGGGYDVTIIEHCNYCKDVGDVAKMFFNQNMYEYEISYEHYRTLINLNLR